MNNKPPQTLPEREGLKTEDKMNEPRNIHHPKGLPFGEI
jgi:hypothetical protein